MLKYASPCAKHTKQKGKSKGKNGSRGGRGIMAARHFPFRGVFLLVRSIIWERGCPAGFPFALLITVNPAASTAAPVSFS